MTAKGLASTAVWFVVVWLEEPLSINIDLPASLHLKYFYPCCLHLPFPLPPCIDRLVFGLFDWSLVAHSPDCSQASYITKDYSELLILLLIPSGCWRWQVCIMPSSEEETRVLMFARQTFTNWAILVAPKCYRFYNPFSASLPPSSIYRVTAKTPVVFRPRDQQYRPSIGPHSVSKLFQQSMMSFIIKDQRPCWRNRQLASECASLALFCLNVKRSDLRE